MVTSLCAAFSSPLLRLPCPKPTVEARVASNQKNVVFELELEAFYPFPPPSRLAEPNVASQLRNLGFGYRAEFVQKTAKMLIDSYKQPELWLASLRDLPTEEARRELLKFMGVGRKVADCILLMSLDKVSPYIFRADISSNYLVDRRKK